MGGRPGTSGTLGRPPGQVVAEAHGGRIGCFSYVANVIAAATFSSRGADDDLAKNKDGENSDETTNHRTCPGESQSPGPP